jgi:hypothetical protein
LKFFVILYILFIGYRIQARMVCNCRHCNHEAVIECETAHCTCCSQKDHDVNIVKDDLEIQDMETVKKF